MIEEDLLIQIYLIWICFGALTGGLRSGWRKIRNISCENDPMYVYPELERPIRAVYHLTRITAMTGWGSAIGGFAAATAPITISVYIWWLYRQEKLQKKK